MPNHVCRGCGKPFYHRKGSRRFCSLDCYHETERRQPNRGTFSAGIVPTNKVPVGTVRIRKRPGRPDVRAFVKVAEPNVWRLRAHVVYEETYGPIPAGLVVHHVNHDRLDDEPENLVAISRAEHLAEHRPDFEHRRATRAAAARWGDRQAGKDR